MTDLTVTHYGPRDARGNPGVATDGGTLTGCAVAPSTTEDTQERATDGVYERLTVYCPDINADVQPTSKITYRGNVYDVDGFPQRWENPFTGSQPGCVFDITRKVG